VSIRTFGKILIGLGVVGGIAVTAWWYLFFEQILGESVKDASACFYRTTTKCSGFNLIGQIGDIPTYDPVVLWVSLIIFSVGIVVYGLSARRK